MGTFVNQALTSLHGGSLKTTLTIPINGNIIQYIRGWNLGRVEWIKQDPENTEATDSNIIDLIRETFKLVIILHPYLIRFNLRLYNKIIFNLIFVAQKIMNV